MKEQELPPPRVPAWVRGFYAAVDSFDLNRHMAVLTDDVQMTFGNNPTMVGHDAVRAGIEAFFRTIAGLQHRFRNVWEHGNEAIVEADVDYTRKDGRVVTIPALTVLRRRGNLIDNIRVYVDHEPLRAL